MPWRNFNFGGGVLSLGPTVASLSRFLSVSICSLASTWLLELPIRLLLDIALVKKRIGDALLVSVDLSLPIRIALMVSHQLFLISIDKVGIIMP